MVDCPRSTCQTPPAELRSCLDRGDVDQMSFAFIAARREWNEGLHQARHHRTSPVRRVRRDVPGERATIIGMRSAATPEPARRGMSLRLALALAETL